jgi:hypothetical protein
VSIVNNGAAEAKGDLADKIKRRGYINLTNAGGAALIPQISTRKPAEANNK